jgi:hypothetical protein
VNIRIPQRLIEHKGAIPVSHGQPVRFGVPVNIIRRHKAAGAGHIFDHRGWISWDMLADMTGDEARVSVVAAARRLAHDETDRLVLIKVLGENRLVVRHQQNKPDRDAKK